MDVVEPVYEEFENEVENDEEELNNEFEEDEDDEKENEVENEVENEENTEVENEENTEKSKFDYVKDKIDYSIEFICNKYKEHPNANGMTVLDHTLFALKLSVLCILSGLLLLVHGLFPWVCTTTGGDLLLFTSKTLENRRTNDKKHLNECVNKD